MNNQFDSDTRALTRRLQTNVAGAKRDLEDWIIGEVRPRAGMRVLDLGCGTGKQSFVMAGRVLPGGEVLGVDISADAVREFNARAEREAVPHARAMQASLDDVLVKLQSMQFDLVISAYAIYYAKDMVGLICGLRSLLPRNGELFICGPGRGTNVEMVRLIERSARHGAQRVPPVEDFLSAGDIETIASCYARCETVRLPNEIRFDSVEGVMGWWENHNSYLPAVRDRVAAALRDEFEAGRGFVLAKNVLGVHLHAE
jgi:SAM-dependent methyltransferase